MTIQKKPKGRAGNMDILIGQKIKAMRYMNNLSQDDLAKTLGITFQQIQKYENGTNRISASRLYDIANAYDIDYGFFFEGSRAKQKISFENVVNNLDKDSAELLRLFHAISSNDLKKSLLRLLRSQDIQPVL